MHEAIPPLHGALCNECSQSWTWCDKVEAWRAGISRLALHDFSSCLAQIGHIIDYVFVLLNQVKKIEIEPIADLEMVSN